MSFFRLSLFYIGLTIANGAYAQSDTRVSLNLKTASSIAAGTTHIAFEIADTKSGKSLSPTDLNITHQKQLHFITYDPALKEFQHVHPNFDGTVWAIDMTFGVDGDYFVWAQGELSSDSTDFNALTRIAVSGGQPAWPARNLTDVRVGSDSGSIATLSNDTVKAGKMAMLMLTFTRSDGSPAQITPYLGAFAHVIATPESGDELTHVHPMNGSKPNEGMLHLDFPTAGAYRIWVQFNDGNILKTVPLSIVVTP